MRIFHGKKNMFLVMVIKKNMKNSKKGNPSFKDKFEILYFFEDEDYGEQIMVNV